MTLTFDNPTAVHNYLVNMGYKMGKSKLNSKLANNLKSMPRKDGVWTQKQIDRYAAGHFEKMNGVSDDATAAIDLKIKEAELRTREGNADKVERENAKAAGQLIERSKMNRELVARMIQLRKDEKTDNKVKAATIISLVGGDIEKEKELQKYLNDATDKRMNTYAKPFKFAIGMSELEKEIALIEAEDS
jgi:hypothetical protein